jgi:hypothetical protein
MQWLESSKMARWLRSHRIAAAALWTVLALAAVEGLLVYHYLNNWFILPLL